MTFSCSATGGLPKPYLSGYVGSEEDNDDDNIELDVEMNESDENDVNTTFRFTPTMQHCGKYLKCSILQDNDINGGSLFGGSSTISKKIHVVYPPQPNQDILSVVYDQGVAEPVDITVINYN